MAHELFGQASITDIHTDIHHVQAVGLRRARGKARAGSKRDPERDTSKYAPDKAKIGSISDLILSKDGKSVEGFLIGVGGFLGIGDKSVALKLDKLKMASGANGAMELSMDMTKDELSNTPTFKSRKDIEAEKVAEQQRSEQPPRPTPRHQVIEVIVRQRRGRLLRPLSSPHAITNARLR